MHLPGSSDLEGRRPANSKACGEEPIHPQPADHRETSSITSGARISSLDPISIRAFVAGDGDAFRELNEAWIRRWFVLEPEDVKLLGDPESQIMARGGQIFVAELKEEVVGCFALLASQGGVLRLARMTVREDQRGRGLGRKLLNHAIETARVLRAPKLVLETSKKLESAVYLYESAGFSYVTPDPATPLPLARADLYMELRLDYG